MIGRPSPLRAPFRPVKTSLLRSAWFAVLLGCGVLAGAPPVACAERIKEPPPAIPPPAQPLSVKVARGESVAILLRIYGRKNQALRYLIRTPPQHGKLTAPRAVELEVSSVTYTPPADLSIVRDRFAYAVQNSAGVSAAADVLITIVDVPAEIGVPEVLNFPMLLVGGTSTQTLEINNRGGGLAEGRVTVDEPWRIDGPANYRIAGGERAVLKVVFAPKEPGIFDTVMRFSSQPGTTLPIHGEARGALTASPAKVRNSRVSSRSRRCVPRAAPTSSPVSPRATMGSSTTPTAARAAMRCRRLRGRSRRRATTPASSGNGTWATIPRRDRALISGWRCRARARWRIPNFMRTAAWSAHRVT